MVTSKEPPSARASVAEVTAWVVCFALLVAALTHVFGSENSTATVAAQDLTPVLYLPAYFVLIYGLKTRRWVTSGLAAALVVAHLWWAGTALIPWPTSSHHVTGMTLRVFESNMEYTNPTQSRIAQEAIQGNSDVVVLVEVQAEEFSAVQAIMKSRLPYVQAQPEQGELGWAVFSRWPLTNLSVEDISGWPFATMEVNIPDATPLTLHVVHTFAPLPDIIRQWRLQLDQLRRDLASAGPNALVVGDFNATRWNPSMSHLISGSLRDARGEGGNHWTPTWPANRKWTPPLFEFDHVLLGRNLSPLKVTTANADGSDHRPLVVSLAIDR